MQNLSLVRGIPKNTLRKFDEILTRKGLPFPILARHWFDLV
jgi:hypothetical protein